MWFVIAICWLVLSAWSEEPILLTNRGADETIRQPTPTGRYFENAIVKMPALSTGQQRYATTVVEGVLENGTQIVDWQNGTPHTMDSLDWAQIYAIYAVLDLDSGYAEQLEADLRLSKQGEASRIVSASLESKTLIKVSTSREWTPTYPAVQREVLERQYGILIQSGSAHWTSEELAVLGDVLTRLSPKEQQYLKGVRFIRDHRSMEAPQSALYVFQSRHNTIIQQVLVYDNAFFGQHHGFVGTSTQPNSVAHMVLLHELAHLLANQRLLVEQRRMQEMISEHNSLVSTYNQQPTEEIAEKIETLIMQINQAQRHAIQGDGPMVDAFVQHRTTTKGPTLYADSALEEAFAESYALFKLDPEALERIDPMVHQWFASGGYLQFLD